MSTNMTNTELVLNILHEYTVDLGSIKSLTASG